jgi:hypothetical protein
LEKWLVPIFQRMIRYQSISGLKVDSAKKERILAKHGFDDDSPKGCDLDLMYA